MKSHGGGWKLIEIYNMKKMVVNAEIKEETMKQYEWVGIDDGWDGIYYQL